MAEGGGGGGGDSGEYLVQIVLAASGRQGKVASPEKPLKCFVRAVALIERLGNALGTLAFTWATVVLLGGYSKDLILEDNFWYATTIVFLEATRMFTHNNRLDYQLFFNTRGAFGSVGWNGLVALLCSFDVFVILWKKDTWSDMWLLFMAIILATVRLLSGLKLHICNPLRRATSLWSPLVAILLTAPPLSDLVNQRYAYHDDDNQQHQIDPSTRWLVFTALFVPVLLVTIRRLKITRISKLVDSILAGKEVVFWRRIITNVCMIAALGMQVYMLHLDPSVNLTAIMIVPVCALAVVSSGNFQVLAAVLRITLAILSFRQQYTDDKKNLAASLRIFYGLVLGQGILYAVACLLEFFSFIPRKSLFCCGGFKGSWEVEIDSLNLYYAYALEKCKQGGVLAPKKIGLCNFAMDFLSLDSSKSQLYGIRMMHSFLQTDATKTQLLSKLTASTKTVARIIRMLDWTSPKDPTIRLYAAKVTAELAKDLRVVTFPGTMQLVSALLEADSRPKRGNLLLLTDEEQEKKQDPFLEDSQEQEHYIAHNQGQRRDPLQDANNLPEETQTHSTQQACIDKQKSYILRCWQWIKELHSIPKEQPSADDDPLPALAMSIIENLAGCDQENCVEISNTADLIPKIIGFTSYTSDMAQHKVLLNSSLKVLRRLTGIGGEIGITLWYKISKHPFLFRNLADILGDYMSSQESRKLVAGILRNIAIDENARQDIGRIPMIIIRLMPAFLNAEGTMSTNADRDHLSMQKVAGQALAMLTTESVQNCFVLLKEPQFIKKLKPMILIHGGNYIYVAASLLRNLCLHGQPELKDSDLKELSDTLREVLKRILDADGAELEILIGLSSQICRVIPEDFTQELEEGQIKRRFVKRLVDTLNANMKPSAHCPGIRRVVLEQVIHLMEWNSCYADCFIEFRMTDALSMVEQTLSKAEDYRLFLGDVGFMKYNMPLPNLVARAKELTGGDCVIAQAHEIRD